MRGNGGLSCLLERPLKGVASDYNWNNAARFGRTSGAAAVHSRAIDVGAEGLYMRAEVLYSWV